MQFAELERGLDDLDRARAIYELGIQQPTLDMPELVWKAYIDFEDYEGEYDRARALYELLLTKTDHVKVWINYARFEINVPDEGTGDQDEPTVSEAAKSRARNIFKRAHTLFKDKEMKEERVELLNAWKSFEQAHGSDEDKQKIDKQMPRRVKKRRRLEEDKFEEYIDYVFPADDESAVKNLNLLERARLWKLQKEAQEAEASDSSANGTNGDTHMNGES